MPQPVSDVLASTAGQHPYAVEAKRRLSRLGIPSLDGFALAKYPGGCRRLFLSREPDSHLSAEGYQALADGLATALLAEPTVRGLFQSD